MDIIVDLQGFKSTYNNFICKELAVASICGSVLDHFIFATPPSLRNFSKENAWITANLHSLRWTDGDVPLNKIREVLDRLISENTTVYVKGLEKKRWIRQYCPQDTHIEDLHQLPSLRSENYGPQPSCTLQHSHCALTNVLKLKAHLTSKQ